MNKSMHLGRAGEHLVTSILLKECRDVYLPAVDDHGVDMLVRTVQTSNPYQYQEIQVKTLQGVTPNNSGGLFAAISCPNPAPNYWFVFYIKDIDIMWLINSLEFVNIASKNKKGKNIGKYSLGLANKKGPRSQFTQYIITDFSKLP